MVRIESAAGRKDAIHFGAIDHALFGFYHPPALALADDAWRGVGVVLCCPLGTDFARSDRTYRHLAERLAADGFAVLRFDHYGTGDSGGAADEPGLVRAWLDDLGVAADELRARSGATTIALAGLRIGATLAMAHAAERGAAEIDALVLWSPVVSGAAFVTEIVKLHKLYARIEPALAGAAPPSADGEEALGMFLSRDVIDALGAIDLRTTTRPARAALVIDGGGGPVTRDAAAVVAHLAAIGCAAELRAYPGHKFLTTIQHRAQLPTEVIDAIVGWLIAQYPARAAAAPVPAARAHVPGPHGEQPLLTGGDRPRFAIRTPADPATRHAGPPILLSNAGCVNRAGSHRLYVALARRWAALGFDVLRVDLSGIGDTPAAPGTVENVTYPPGGFDDLAAAIDFLGAPRVIVVGLCSGGDYAFQLGARMPARIASAVILNPRTFLALDLHTVESQPDAPPTAAAASVPVALRAMADAGVDTYLLVSQLDPGIAYVDAHLPAEMRALAGVANFTRVDITGSDHTFTPVTVQAHVGDLVTAHLVARYVAG